MMSIQELLTTVHKHNPNDVMKEVLSRVNEADDETYVGAFATDNPRGWHIALECLVAMNRIEPYYERVLSTLVSYIEAAPEDSLKGAIIIAIRHMLRKFPAEAIRPIGRRWLNSPVWNKSLLGEDILVKHATLDDLGLVREVLTEYLRDATTRDNNMPMITSLLDILKRFPNIGLLPEVEDAYILTDYAFARMRAAKAMSVNAPSHFSETYAYELLWDCEEESRIIGCEAVSLSLPGARERLVALADDPIEIDSVPAAASKRLAANI